MATAIRKHLRDFIAVAVLIVVGARVTTYIIVEQQRLRIPVLEEKPFELKAEFETAQAVVPGQGQTIRVAGVRGRRRRRRRARERRRRRHLRDRPQVPADLQGRDDPDAPDDRPQGHVLRARPGHASPPASTTEGDTIPAANTAPDVNLDEILAALDGDTPGLPGCAGRRRQGLDGRDKDLGKLLGGLGPINQDLAQLNTMVAERRQNLADLIHNLNVLTDDGRPVTTTT